MGTSYDELTDLGMVVVTSEGSRWEFWETEHRYRRSPLTEVNRENPSWGGPEAGPLEDHVWHDFTTWYFDDHPFWPRLWIELPDGTCVRAPSPSSTSGRTQHECGRCEANDYA